MATDGHGHQQDPPHRPASRLQIQQVEAAGQPPEAEEGAGQPAEFDDLLLERARCFALAQELEVRRAARATP